MDIPNERSSHVEPVPRGGGIVFVAICLASALIYGAIWERTLLYFFAGGIVVVAISWLDDVLSLPVWIRFLTHSVTAFLVIYLLGYWDNLYIPVLGDVYLGSFGMVVTFLWIVWVINAYNFMDGIDGLMSALGVVAGAGWAVVSIVSKSESVFFLTSVVVTSVLGFLVHNWSPAKVFMGDVGSTFLGYCFAVMPLLASGLLFQQVPNGFWFTFAVFCLFLPLFDTTFTLIRRALRGEKVWQAHRSHLYQRLVKAGIPHDKVTMFYIFLSLFTANSAVWMLLFIGSKDHELVPVVLGLLSVLFLVVAVDIVEKRKVK